MVGHRQRIRECLEGAGLVADVDDGSGECAFQTDQDLAIEAAAVFLRALLEQGVQLIRDVLECQGDHELLRGTIMEPGKIVARTHNPSNMKAAVHRVLVLLAAACASVASFASDTPSNFVRWRAGLASSAQPTAAWLEK